MNVGIDAFKLINIRFLAFQAGISARALGDQERFNSILGSYTYAYVSNNTSQTATMLKPLLWARGFPFLWSWIQVIFHIAVA